MFIGHFAVGFAAKRAAPRVSLAVLFVAAQFADLLWPILVALGIEQVRIDPGNTALTPLDFVSYPYSHSLLMLIGWGVVLGWLCAARDTSAARVASGFSRTFLVIALLVLSHWFLDWMTHRPDMPLYPGGPKFGLGMWNSVAATVLVELAMFAAGLWIYIRTTRARDAVGRWSFVVFVLFLLGIYAGNVVSPPPPSVTAIWIAGIVGGAILLVWSARFDRHRDPRTLSA
jgi:LexA-binding, inner membrane-associated putative hydrolase